MTKKTKAPKNYLTEDDLKPENIKANITIRMSLDLVQGYKAEADRLGIGYQTLMQIKLREGLNNTLEKRIEAVEQKLKKHG